MRYRRMPIEVESPEQLGYDTIANNLSESSVADRRLADLAALVDHPLDLDGLVLCYGDHLGDPDLRAAVAASSGVPSVDADHVLVTPGAATALFLVATSQLEPGDHAVVVRSNYATNLETPRAIGADLEVHDLAFEDGWALDVDAFCARIRPGATKLVSITTPHNPTGTVVPPADIARISAVAGEAGAVLLVDETYRDLTHDGAPPPLATGLGDHVVSVGSMSKAYGLPGLRTGWAVCTGAALAEQLLAAKEQVVISGSIVDEHLAARVLGCRDEVLPPIVTDVRDRLAVVDGWLQASSTFEWVRPAGGVVGLVRFRPEVAVDEAEFHRVLLADHGTYVGPGHWFEQSDRSFRLGFGWPTLEELRAGLAGLDAAATDAAR